MRYFFDTEFNEDVHPIELISIGIVREDGREWYGINRAYSNWQEYQQTLADGGTDLSQFAPIISCNDWVKKHVLPILYQQNGPTAAGVWCVADELRLRDEIVNFVGADQSPEFWAYYGAYDWYLLTRMFRSFDKMPVKWPQTAYDLHQYARHHGMSRALPKKFEPVHNALVDARWTRESYNFIKQRSDELANYKERIIWP